MLDLVSKQTTPTSQANVQETVCKFLALMINHPQVSEWWALVDPILGSMELFSLGPAWHKFQIDMQENP